MSHLPGLFISPTQMGTAITTAISGIPVGELPQQVHLDIAAAVQALPVGSTPAQVQAAISTALAGQPVGELPAQVHADIAAAVAALPAGATSAQVTAAITSATSGLADGTTISMSGGKLSVIGSAYQVLSGPILATDTLLVLRGTTPFLANQAEAQAWVGTSSTTPSPTPTPTPSPSPTPTPTPTNAHPLTMTNAIYGTGRAGFGNALTGGSGTGNIPLPAAARSIGFWFQAPTAPGNNNAGILVNNTDVTGVVLTSGGNASVINPYGHNNGSINVCDGAWHWINSVFTNDSGNDNILYVDGAQVGGGNANVTSSANPNAVHFAIRMAALKLMRVVGCGVRGRNG